MASNTASKYQLLEEIKLLRGKLNEKDRNLKDLRDEISQLRLELQNPNNGRSEDTIRNHYLEERAERIEKDRERNEKIQEAIALVTKMNVKQETLSDKLPELESVQDVRRYKLNKIENYLESEKEKVWELISSIASLLVYDNLKEILPEERSDSLKTAKKKGIELSNKIGRYIDNANALAEEWNIHEGTGGRSIRNIDIPHFNGLNTSSSIYDWLEELTSYCNAASIPLDEQGAVFFSCLGEPAKGHVKLRIGNHVNPDSHEIQEVLIEEYGEPRSVVRTFMKRHRELGRIKIYNSCLQTNFQINEISTEHLIIIKSLEKMISYLRSIDRDDQVVGKMIFDDYIAVIENHVLAVNKVMDFMTMKRGKPALEKLEIAKKMIQVGLDLSRERIAEAESERKSSKRTPTYEDDYEQYRDPPEDSFEEEVFKKPLACKENPDDDFYDEEEGEEEEVLDEYESDEEPDDDFYDEEEGEEEEVLDEYESDEEPELV